MTEKRLPLRLLKELQDLDEEIASLEASTREIPKAIKGIEAGAQAARAEQANLQARQKTLDHDRRAGESDLEQVRENLRKALTKQLEVKTNKEYSALLQEIESFKDRIDRLETEVLEMMEESESLAEEVRRGAESLRDKEAQGERHKREKQEELKQTEGRLATLREDRECLSPAIGKEWLTLYGRVRAARGNAVVSLNGTSCAGCHRNLMPQLIHLVKHGDNIQTCPHCNRILFPPEEAPKAVESAPPAEPTQA